MPGALAAQLPATREQFFQHVAVADLGPHHGHAHLAQRHFDRHVGHQRADHARHGLALRQALGGHHVEQFVAVVQAALGIDDLQPVGVAVERDAVVGTVLGHRRHQRRRRRGADTSVDVDAVGLAADLHDRRAKFVEHVGCHVVAGAVRGVDDDLQPAQRQAVRHRALAELDVAAAGVVQAPGLAQRLGVHPLR